MSYRLGYAPLSEHPEHWSRKVAGRQSRALPYLGLASALGYLPQTFQDQASRYSLYGGIRQPALSKFHPSVGGQRRISFCLLFHRCKVYNNGKQRVSNLRVCYMQSQNIFVYMSDGQSKTT